MYYVNESAWIIPISNYSSMTKVLMLATASDTETKYKRLSSLLVAMSLL